MDGMVESHPPVGLLSDPDEPFMLSDPEFEGSGGYVSDFMSHQLPRIEVDDKSDPVPDLEQTACVASARKSTPTKTGLKSRHQDIRESSNGIGAGRQLQKCTNCGDGIWQRMAAAKCNFSSSSILCASCRSAQSLKKRRNRSSSASGSTSSTVLTSSSETSITDSVSASRNTLGHLSQGGKSRSGAPDTSSLSGVPSVKVEAGSEAKPMHIKPSTHWAPVSTRRKLYDEETTASQDCQRFYFESDQLVQKSNPDFHLLMRTLSVLEAQRCQALKDIDTLHQTKAMALADPAAFVEGLRNDPSKLEVPSAQPVMETPQIDWSYYSSAMAATTKSSKGRHSKKGLHSNPDHSSISTAGQSSGGASMETFGRTGQSGQQPIALPPPSASPGLEDLGDTGSSGSYSSQRNTSDSKPKVVSQPWTVDELSRLEKLAVKYASEPETRRWRKIAVELRTNRTPRQVAARILKHPPKLHKALVSTSGKSASPAFRKSSKKSSSTFEPRGKHVSSISRSSSVFSMSDPLVSAEGSDAAFAEDDDSSLPSSQLSLSRNATHNLVDSDYCSEELDRSRSSVSGGKSSSQSQSRSQVPYVVTEEQHADIDLDFHMQHPNYQCDGCGQEPLLGIRWHCEDCPESDSLDFCNDCVDHCSIDTAIHRRTHHLRPIRPLPPAAIMEQDFAVFSQPSSSLGRSNMCFT